MEKNVKIALIGGGVALLVGFLVINTPNLASSCMGWNDGIYDKHNYLNSQELDDRWLDYQRELYQYAVICYPFGAEVGWSESGGPSIIEMLNQPELIFN